MIRRISILLALLAITAYVIVAMTMFNGKPDKETCKGMELTIRDSVNYGFVNYSEVKRILQKNGQFPQGKKKEDINVRMLEETLNKHPFINQAECYFTSGDKIAVNIYQRVPVLHVISDEGDDFYIDHLGKIMDIPDRPVHVAVATGCINRKFARERLYPIGKYLQADRFWNSQVEQIYVDEKQELQLVPRVGNQILFFGSSDDYTEKFRKLRAFYQEALTKVGWNKYSRINMEFGNQIICTKKEK